MKPTSNRSTTLTLLCAGVAGAALVTAALAQPPRPGGTPAPGGAPAPGAPAPGAPAPGGGPGGGGPGPGGGGPGPGGGGPGGAPTPSPTFEFRMCNKTKDIPVIFVATVGATGQQFHAQGWTQVPLGQCVVTGPICAPRLYTTISMGPMSASIAATRSSMLPSSAALSRNPDADPPSFLDLRDHSVQAVLVAAPAQHRVISLFGKASRHISADAGSGTYHQTNRFHRMVASVIGVAS